MRKIILIFLSLPFLLEGFSQSNTPPGYTKSDEISQSRRILLDKFIEKDRLGTRLEMDRLLMHDDQDYLALYPIEFWLLSYWLNDYNSILHYVKEPKEEGNSKIIKIPPQRDYLTPKLIEKSVDQKDTLLQNIKLAKITAEEKQFLLIHLDYLLPTDADQSAKQDELNKLADEFLNKYPNSDYAGFTKQYIRVKYEVVDRGFAFGVHSGKLLFSGNLNDYYRHPTLLGFSMDLIKDRWLWQLNLSVGFSKTKKDMPIDTDIWPQNSKAIGGHVNLCVGRYIVDNKIFSIAPLAGVGIFGFDPNTDENKDPEYKGAGIKTNIAGNVGFVSDIKLTKGNASNWSYYGGVSFTSIRIGYDFIMSPLKNNFIDYSGTVHKVTVGIAFSTKRIQRVP